MQFHFILGWFHLKLCMTKVGGGGGSALADCEKGEFD